MSLSGGTLLMAASTFEAWSIRQFKIAMSPLHPGLCKPN
jgi:hypothetical protein